MKVNISRELSVSIATSHESTDLSIAVNDRNTPRHDFESVLQCTPQASCDSPISVDGAALTADGVEKIRKKLGRNSKHAYADLEEETVRSANFPGTTVNVINGRQNAKNVF